MRLHSSTTSCGQVAAQRRVIQESGDAPRHSLYVPWFVEESGHIVLDNFWHSTRCRSDDGNLRSHPLNNDPPERFWLDGGVLERSDDRIRVLEALGRWIRRIHESGIWQRDLKVHNVMVRDWSTPDPEFQLVDVHAVRFYSRPLRRARRVRNLGQILDVPGHLDEEFEEPLLNAYLEDASETPKWRPGVRRATEARRRERQREQGFRFMDEPTQQSRATSR